MAKPNWLDAGPGRNWVRGQQAGKVRLAQPLQLHHKSLVKIPHMGRRAAKADQPQQQKLAKNVCHHLHSFPSTGPERYHTVMAIECLLPGCHRPGPTGILPAMQSNAHSVLEHVFGYHQFRGEQPEPLSIP